MKVILSKLLNFLKFILMFISFALILMGILFTYKRLDKSLTEAINIFIPFILVILLTLINMFSRKAKISENLLFNFSSILVFICIIIIGVRAKFDTSMILYHKYKINYNPNYLADNLSTIKVLLYCLSGANIFLLLQPLFREKETINKNTVVEQNETLSTNITASQQNEEKEIMERIPTFDMNMTPESNNTEEL